MPNDRDQYYFEIFNVNYCFFHAPSAYARILTFMSHGNKVPESGLP